MTKNQQTPVIGESRFVVTFQLSLLYGVIGASFTLALTFIIPVVSQGEVSYSPTMRTVVVLHSFSIFVFSGFLASLGSRLTYSLSISVLGIALAISVSRPIQVYFKVNYMKVEPPEHEAWRFLIIQLCFVIIAFFVYQLSRLLLRTVHDQATGVTPENNAL